MLQTGGKWAPATVVDPAATAVSPPAGLPHCLKYKDGMEWVRFVSAQVLEGWRPPKTGGRRAAAAAQPHPSDMATTVRAFVLVPEDFRPKGRPTKERTEAMTAAEAAAEAYKQQLGADDRNGGGSDSDSGSGGGSPAKKRRLTTRRSQPNPEAEHQQQAVGDGGKEANGGLLSPSSHEQSSAAALHGPDLACGAAMTLGRSKPAAGAAAKRARADGKAQPMQQQQRRREQQQQQQQQQQQDEAPPNAAAVQGAQEQPADPASQAGQQGAAPDELSSGAGLQLDRLLQDRSAADGTGAGAAVDPAALQAGAAPPAVPVEPKRPAVTELGSSLGLLRPLAMVPTAAKAEEGEDEDEGEQRRRRQQRDLSARSSQQQHAQLRSRGALERDARGSQQLQQQLEERQQQGEDEAQQEAARSAQERPGDRACRAFAELLPGVTQYRESITAASRVAIDAGAPWECWCWALGSRPHRVLPCRLRLLPRPRCYRALRLSLPPCSARRQAGSGQAGRACGAGAHAAGGSGHAARHLFLPTRCNPRGELVGWSRVCVLTCSCWCCCWCCLLACRFPTSAPHARSAVQQVRREGDGTGAVCTLFPRVVGAALSQLVDLLSGSLEAAEKVRCRAPL